MSDTPLYDQLLADVLLRARQDADARVAAAERAAAARVAEAERTAAAQVAAAERRAAAAEERVRADLAGAPSPLPALQVQEEQAAPPLPPAAEVFATNPGVGRFLDALLGGPSPAGPA